MVLPNGINDYTFPQTKALTALPSSAAQAPKLQFYYTAFVSKNKYTITNIHVQ